MSAHPDLTTLDADGALQPATEQERASGRRSFLKRGAMAGGGVVAFGTIFDTLASPAGATVLFGGGRSPLRDIKVLNYALTLEYLEAEFYAQAVANQAWASPQIELFARTTAQHEADHVTALQGILGKRAVAKPTFNFGAAVTDPATFLATAAVLEDTGVTAYSGQVTSIFLEAYLKAATSILTVEARHASWARFLLGGGEPGSPAANQPAPSTFDTPATMATVLKAVAGTGFIVG